MKANMTKQQLLKARHKQLLNDPDVRRWYSNIARESKLTADVRLRRLGRFCERHNITPKNIIEIGQSDIKKLDDLMLDDVSYLEDQGYAPSYIEDIVKSMRSWLSHNYIQATHKIKIKNADIPVTLENEVIPTRKQLDQVMVSASPRTRTIICIMGFAGVRPQVLGKHDASDGLKISDVEGLRITPDGKVFFEKIPAKVTVRRPLSKAGHQYFTFLPKLGCDCLAGYLRERLSHGEIILSDSPVITINYGYSTKRRPNPVAKDSKFVRTSRISNSVKDSFRVILKERPYVLRSYFDSHLLEAENNHKIAHAYRQFFMGHKGDIEAKYTTNKQSLAESMKDDMRKAYAESLPYLLQENEKPVSEENKKQILFDMLQEQAKILGIDPVHLKIESQRDSDDKIKTIKDAISEKVNSKPQTQIIKSEQVLIDYLTPGWELVKEIRDERFLIRNK